MEYLWVVDGNKENLIDNAANAECTAEIDGGSLITDYSGWANRVWLLGSGDAADTYDSCAGTSILSGSWDFDENGVGDALTDGLLLLRYTFGLRGASLTDGAIATNSLLTPAEVEANVAAAAGHFGDIDNNGEVDALTDGLMLLRYMFGLRGDALIGDAVAGNAERTSAAGIETYIVSLMP